VTRSSASQLTGMVLIYLALLLITLCAIYPLGALAASRAPAALQKDAADLRRLEEVGLVALTVAISGLALASAAGYALSRSRFLRRSATLGRALLAQLWPAAILLTALCLALVWLGLISSYLGLFAIYLLTTLPFCIWQMKRYYDTISVSLEEAAEIDGASAGQTFSRILFPLSTPALAVTGLFSFCMAWNEYAIGAIFLRNAGIFALPVALSGFEMRPMLPSVALLVSIPATLAFLILTRLFFTGLPVEAANN
jgi:arabinogalactan oligomer / maltooligosaccharide transport system permease protein